MPLINAYKMTSPRSSHGRRREVDLVLYGLGQIGQSLVRQLLSQQAYFLKKYQLNMPISGVADRSGFCFQAGGFEADELTAFLQKKVQRLKIRDGLDVIPIEEQQARLWQRTERSRVLVDLTATESSPLIEQALLNGYHVVLANKKPLTVSYQEFLALHDNASTSRLAFRYEATVGAGLPVLDTLSKLEAAGDEVQEIIGCLSGTLGYLMTQMEDGLRFSEAVRKAYENGYTEPDPREDLSGADIARKALILARTMGIAVEWNDIELKSLFPKELGSPDAETFLRNLQALDTHYSQLNRSAWRRGHVLRFVARIRPEKVLVGLEEVPKDSAFGRLRGADNQISISSRWYAQSPLIIAGPGAGAEVTAGGVLNDILAVAEHL